jgi:hypothetical protein
VVVGPGGPGSPVAVLEVDQHLTGGGAGGVGADLIVGIGQSPIPGLGVVHLRGKG